MGRILRGIRRVRIGGTRGLEQGGDGGPGRREGRKGLDPDEEAMEVVLHRTCQVTIAQKPHTRSG